MKATTGDHILVHGHKVGDQNREGEVLQVLGQRGEPPYRVRWADGHEGVYFPSSDCNLLGGAPARSAGRRPAQPAGRRAARPADG